MRSHVLMAAMVRAVSTGATASMTPSVIQWRADVTAALATEEIGARIGVTRVIMVRVVTRRVSVLTLTTCVTQCWAASASRVTPAPTAPPPPPSLPCGPTLTSSSTRIMTALSLSACSSQSC